jgi:PAS domain S-box-containing protein
LFNKGAEAMFGYTAREVIGKKLEMLMPSRFQGPHLEHVEQFGRKQDHYRRMAPVRQVMGLRKNGEEFPLEASSSKLTLNGEKIYTAILRDATERIQGEELVRQLHLDLEKRVLDRTADLERANQALQGEIKVRTSAEEMLSQLSGRLLQLQDEERRRVARELHDSTAQYLVALALNISEVTLDGANNLLPELKAKLGEALGLVDQCTAEIRTMSYLLHPPLLDELGLVPALEWYAAGFKKRSGIAVQLELPPSSVRIPADFERTLFRIVQEGLSNVHRHSGGSKVTISLVVNDHEIRLDLGDNGNGIAGFTHIVMTDDVVALLGVGIAGMRERVRQLGGHLEISSSDRGTMVTTCFAVPQAEGTPADSGVARG